MQTIKQLADALGVSKTAIRNHMNEAFREKYTEKDSKGVFTISPEGCKLISEKYNKSTENCANKFAEITENTVSGDMVALLQATIETLREQLTVKDQQLAAKDQQIAELTRLADQAQQLHAGTIKQALPEGETAATVAPEVEVSESAKKWSWPWKRKENRI